MTVVSLKIYLDKEIRRVGLPSTATIEELKSTIRNIFPQILNENFTLHVLYDEKTSVPINSYDDFQRLVVSNTSKLVKIDINITKGPHLEDFSHQSNLFVHETKVCSVCGCSPIIGPLFICLVRSEYFLCGSCEEKSVDGHPLLKVKDPRLAPISMNVSFSEDDSSQYSEDSGIRHYRHNFPPTTHHYPRLLHHPHHARPPLPDHIHHPHHHPPRGPHIFPPPPDCIQRENGNNVNLRIPKPALRFIKHISFPDGSIVRAGEEFIKTWRVRNDGKKPWPSGITLIPAGGDLMCSEDHKESLPILEVDEEREISISLRAPDKSGLHTGFFRVQTENKQLFGHRLWASVMVVDEK